MYISALIKALNINFIFKLNSLLWKILLQLNNVKVGKNFYVEGAISLKLKGSRKDPIVFEDNISIFGNLDLRTRENGKIIVCSDVKFDSNIRLVAARSGLISIGDGTKIGCNTIMNAGENIFIERNCLIGAYCNINSSDHIAEGKKDVTELGYKHSPIEIGRGVWIGTNVVILPGVKVGKGSIVGASSVVTKNISNFSISVGIPSKTIKKRQ